MLRSRIFVVGLALALTFGATATRTQAQADRTAFNTIYVELGGNGLIYSLNYERITPQNLSLRGGFGALSVSATAGSASSDATITTIPLTASYLGLGGSHKLEIGIGAALVKFSGQSSTGFGDDVEVGALVPIGTAIFGYRYAPVGGGFNFRLALTPFFGGGIGVFPWGGLAFGYGF